MGITNNPSQACSDEEFLNIINSSFHIATALDKLSTTLYTAHHVQLFLNLIKESLNALSKDSSQKQKIEITADQIKLLGSMELPEDKNIILDTLIDIVRTSHLYELRQQAVLAIGSINDTSDKAIDAIFYALEDNDTRIGEAAYEMLIRLSRRSDIGNELVNRCLTSLNSVYQPKRIFAAKALSDIGSINELSTVNALCDRLEDVYPSVRLNAILTLSKLIHANHPLKSANDNNDAISIIVDKLLTVSTSDRTPSVKEAALQALFSFPSELLVNTLLKQKSLILEVSNANERKAFTGPNASQYNKGTTIFPAVSNNNNGNTTEEPKNTTTLTH